MAGKWDHIEKPGLVVLNFSGGKQSSALLWMVLRGDIEINKERFIVLNADPGMENSDTYEYVQMMFDECRKQGIWCRTVRGRNLYRDIVNLSSTEATRMDNPPYWTKSKKGSRGRLVQKCTWKYKIQPMDRMIRKIMEERYDIGTRAKRVPSKFVEKWIGFSYSEVLRVKPSKQKYVYFRYPLIEMKMHNQDVLDYFTNNNLPVPPRSVCNACFANGLESLYKMYKERKQDWEQAVAVDDSVRDWSQIGVNDEVYVSNTLIPLRVLGQHFSLLNGHTTKEDLQELVKEIKGDVDDLENDYSCDSGYCFV